jgi:hypothetical protein
VKSTPTPPAHEVKFEEKSGGDAVCAAALATVNAAAMPPARICAVEANLDIVLSLVSSPTGLDRTRSAMNPGGGSSLGYIGRDAHVIARAACDAIRKCRGVQRYYLAVTAVQREGLRRDTVSVCSMRGINVFPALKGRDFDYRRTTFRPDT